MKHFTKCLKFLLLLFGLLGGVNSVFAEDTSTTYSFSSKSWAATPANWSGTKDGNQFNSSGTPLGVQVTASLSGVVVTSPKSFSNVKQVVVTYSSSSKGVGSIEVKVGETSIGSQDISKSQTNVSLTYDASNLTGNVSFTVTCNTNSLGINSIKIVEAEAVPSTTACATPTFTPAADAVLSGTDVSITTETEGAIIYYTTDGSTPTTKSSVYSSAISVTSAMTIKAIAVKEGYDNSEVATASYTIAAQLSSIALSGTYPTTFTEGQAFSHDGLTVTANYDNSTNADVTESATFSGYDMSTTGSQTVTVSYTENNVTKTATYGITVQEIPSHTVTWNINGNTDNTASVKEGADIEFPTGLSDAYEKKFVGWVAAPIDGTTNTEPSFVTEATMGNADVTYYAVFATLVPGTKTEVTDVLTRETTGVTGTTYTSWSNKKVASVAVYAGNSAGGNEAIQLRSTNNAGIISTTTGGKVKKVNITWNSNTTSGRTLNIYGKNFAYTAVSDLYNETNNGTKLGTVVYGTSTEFNITGNYSYVGVRSSDGALYATKISITWESGTPDTYSEYCTTVAPPTTVKNPTLSVEAGEYTEAQSVELACTTDGADIYYTTDGSAPTTSSTKYTGAIIVNSSMTIKAIGVKDGLESSEVVSATYTLKAVAPSFSVEAGEYSVAPTLTLTSTTDGSIYYTTDGTVPTSSSTLYTAPFVVTTASTVKAVTIKSGWSDSDVSEAAYTINIEEPTISNLGSKLTLEGAEGTTVYYTIDGSTPNNGSTEYTGVVDLAESCTVKAIAYDAYGNCSDVVSKDVTFISGDIIWAEDFSGYSKDDVPTEGANATYVMVNGGGNTKIWTESSTTEGQSPELLIGKKQNSLQGSMTSIINLRRYYGTVSLTFLSNYPDRLTVTSTTANVTKNSETNEGQRKTVSFSVPEGKETLVLVITNTSSSNARVDNFELYASSRSNPSVTVSSAGYATYVTDVAVDYSQVDGVTAYVASAVNGEYITLAEVTSVPANAPVIVKAAEGKHPLVLAESASAPASNLLQVSDGTVTGGNGIYALAQKDGVVGFYLVDASVTIPAGKCYLSVGSGNEAKARLLFGFGDASGIATVAGDGQEDGSIYNLSGQRVGAGYKGIVIKNGKKYLNK